MADDTPSGNPPTSPAEFALETLARALREASDSYRARLEVYRGLSGAERDAGLAREADRARDVRHLAAEAEQLLRALVGYRSDPVQLAAVVPKPTGLTRWQALGVVGGTLATLLTALAAFWDSITGHAKP